MNSPFSNNPFEDYVSQFVHVLQQEQTAQAQALTQLLHQISEPVHQAIEQAATAICEIVSPVQSYLPTHTPDVQHLGDFFHSLLECVAAPDTSSSAQLLNASSVEIHKAFDFHLS